jgi:hypothetical protein
MAVLDNWEDIGTKHLRELFLRLLGLCIRNSALPVLVLTTLCDDFLKPFLSNYSLLNKIFFFIIYNTFLKPFQSKIRYQRKINLEYPK